MNTHYEAPYYFKNPFLNTVYPTLFRKIDAPFKSLREIVTLRDNDIVSYDWYCAKRRRLTLISHGLGGHSERVYVKGMATSLVKQGWDVAAWNYRACGPVMNLTPHLYHGGISDDLADVITHIENKDIYDEIALVGFSIGGNINLLYLGENTELVSSLVKKAVVFSVPCDLKACAIELEKAKNIIFMQYFLRNFRRLIAEKEKVFPEHFRERDFDTIKNFRDYDNKYTAPLHGFKDADHYWKSCSSKKHIPAIRTKTLIIMAKDDPFLSNGCYPYEESASNNCITLLTPQHGGHVGFCGSNRNGAFWSEEVAAEFLN